MRVHDRNNAQGKLEEDAREELRFIGRPSAFIHDEVGTMPRKGVK